MYVQALICSVGLKYYKHFAFSDSGHLLFEDATSLISCGCNRFLFVCICFDSSVDWLASFLECIPRPLMRRTYVHINGEQANAEGNTSWLLADNLWAQTSYTDNINSFCASTVFFFLISASPSSQNNFVYPVLNQTAWIPGRLFHNYYFVIIIINYIVISVVTFSFVSICKC